MKEEIAISGVSGRFPKCSNVEELKRNLFDGINLITEGHTRYAYEAYETPACIGQLKDIETFDAPFFGMNPKQFDFADPRRRILTEVTYEALLDAGINPIELRGTNTGVFLGAISEHGTMASMIANGISYTFDLKGPSMSIETGCSSGLYAVHQAIEAIRSGICDKAIACTAHLQTTSLVTPEYMKYKPLSPVGKCKPFTADRAGFVESEAIVSVVLEKAKDAKRIYATIEGIGINVNGYKMEGIVTTCAKTQHQLMTEVYQKNNINPNDVTYVEAHGTGTRVGDFEELSALGKFFCNNRGDPLPVGSIKSNLGHSEMAAGLVSLVKALIIIESGYIPRNLHFDKPADDIPQIQNGDVKVIAENTPFKPGFIAINSFGLGGTNSHSVLRPYDKKSQNITKPAYRLVLASGRTIESVKVILDAAKDNENCQDFLNLLDEIFSISIPRHGYRGYTLLCDKPKQEIADLKQLDRPLWFVYSGMGSQWPGMAKDLMKLDVFASSMKRCARVLKPYGVDLIRLVTSGTEKDFDNVINCFAGIASMAVCLTDVLYSLGLKPDGIIGHSLGEVGCAYADGSLSAEETVLAGYARGYATLQTKLEVGLMAAVGLPLDECVQLLPKDVYVACINCHDNITVSGPAASVESFVNKLASQRKFAKIINTSNIAFHSPYIASAGPHMLNFLKDVIQYPKPRTGKWLSSAIKKEEWGGKLAQYSSPEYHHHNYMNQVLFEQVLEKVPSDAILVEVSSKGLMQPILKRALKKTVTNIHISDNTSEDNLQFFMSSVGRIFNAGAQPNLKKFYPREFPVGKDTPMIGSLIRWSPVSKYEVPSGSLEQFGETIIIDMLDSANKYLTGHAPDGKLIYPASGFVVLAWKTFAKMYGKSLATQPVVIKDIQFLQAVMLPENSKVKLTVNIFKGSGHFEIRQLDDVVAKGRIYKPDDISKEFTTIYTTKPKDDKYLKLRNQDVYKELQLRGYTYGGPFRAIMESDNYGENVDIAWHDNWISFLDCMFQTYFLRWFSGYYLPTQIQKVTIDPTEFLNKMNEIKSDLKIVRTRYNQYQNSVKACGVEIENVKFTKIMRPLEKVGPTHEKYAFVPYFEDNIVNEEVEDPFFKSIHLSLQFIRENIGDQVKLTVLETLSSSLAESKCLQFSRHHKSIYLVNVEFNTTEIEMISKYKTSNDLLVVDSDYKEYLSDELLEMTKFVHIEADDIDEEYLKSKNLVIVLKTKSENEHYHLLKHIKPSAKKATVLYITDKDLLWVEDLKAAMKQMAEEDSILYLVTNAPDSGIVGMFNCLKLETAGKNLRVYLVPNGERFSFTSAFYKDQIQLDLAVNIFEDNKWGTYKYQLLEPAKPSPSKYATVSLLEPANLSSLKWLEKAAFHSKSDHQVRVIYSALNAKDAQKASGKLEITDDVNDLKLGQEFSGIDQNGKRVMGISQSGSLSTYVTADQDLTWEIPEKWSLQQAATVPIIGLTVCYAMIARGQLQEGETVLIHGGTGEVGLAAISLALKFKCTVYTTVSSQLQKDALKAIFPQLKDNHIGYAGDASFEELIIKDTKDKGVDLVLNCLVHCQFQASLRCAANFGRFVEIGPIDLMQDTTIGSSLLLKNCAFIVVEVISMLTDPTQKKKYGKLMVDWVKRGLLEPIKATVFENNQLEEAFRFFTKGKHIGKILIKISHNEKRFENESNLLAIPRTYFNPEKSYVIIGGFGGLGLEMCSWLIERGATKLVINARRNVNNGYESFCIRKWEHGGAIVKINNDDCSTEEGAKKLLTFAASLGPVGGLFNAALVVRDSIIENQTVEMFDQVFKAKNYITKYLDKLSRIMCPKLDHFVAFSSISGGVGNLGQSNYGYANCYIERLCIRRRKDGLPGVGIEYGPIADVGFLETADLEERRTHLHAMSVVFQRVDSCLNSLDFFMQQSNGAVAAVIVDNSNKTFSAKKSVFRDLLGMDDDSNLEEDVPLVNFGIDSILAFELKHFLARDYDVDLSIGEIRNLTVRKIKEMHANKYGKKV